VTCRSVAKKIGVSESAARNRLNRSDDPKKIFAPYSPSNGGQPKKDKLPKSATVLPIDDPMYILAFGGAEAYKRAIEKQNA
jgi:transposase